MLGDCLPPLPLVVKRASLHIKRSIERYYNFLPVIIPPLVPTHRTFPFWYFWCAQHLLHFDSSIESSKQSSHNTWLSPISHPHLEQVLITAPLTNVFANKKDRHNIVLPYSLSSSSDHSPEHERGKTPQADTTPFTESPNPIPGLIIHSNQLPPLMGAAPQNDP